MRSVRFSGIYRFRNVLILVNPAGWRMALGAGGAGRSWRCSSRRAAAWLRRDPLVIKDGLVGLKEGVG